MKELAEEFEGQFTCLVENTEKYITLKNEILKKMKNLQPIGMIVCYLHQKFKSNIKSWITFEKSAQSYYI